ncbi:MAG: hypothetical protein RLZZ241_2417 [Bacteroidota bacterium]|jgi:pyridoxal phosphate enzyme (YggS family)
MGSIGDRISEIQKSLPNGVALIAVSKTRNNEEILEAYQVGQRAFGENKVQELVAKYEELPKDIEWHMIGHLQRNKVKYIAGFVHLIHGVDSMRLLEEINRRGGIENRVIDCLLQVHIAEETTKFGFDTSEISSILDGPELKAMLNVKIRGLMGMATFTEDQSQISREFTTLKKVFDTCIVPRISNPILSMGMSGDYPLAVLAGSTMVRIGSSIFGNRMY